jgi:hypothetical protein
MVCKISITGSFKTSRWPVFMKFLEKAGKKQSPQSRTDVEKPRQTNTYQVNPVSNGKKIKSGRLAWYELVYEQKEPMNFGSIYSNIEFVSDMKVYMSYLKVAKEDKNLESEPVNQKRDEQWFARFMNLANAIYKHRADSGSSIKGWETSFSFSNLRLI